MNITEELVYAGQAVYTKGTQSAYDFFVLGISNPYVWKCPTPRLVALYNEYASANHLDVGIGTGYFLDYCRFPSLTQRVALMDLNQISIEVASERIARYKPETYQRNVLEPIRINASLFDSVGLNYLLHCVPGSIETKSVVFDHLKTLIKPNAVLFGATLLQGGVQRSWLARRLMDVCNKKGIFSNQADHLEGLTKELHKRFSDVSVEVVGCAALFAGRA